MKHPKLKRDWAGRYVRLKYEMENNGGSIFEKGEVMKVEKNYGGLRLSAVRACKTCRLRRRHLISKVSEQSVDLLPEDYRE